MSPESLIEERVAQLKAISERRNDLLREMYYMMRRREDVGPVLTLNDEDDDALHMFLKKFDLSNNPETGSITNLVENELFAPPLSHHAPSPRPPKGKLDLDVPRRSRRSKSRVVEVVEPPSDAPMEAVLDYPPLPERSTSQHAEELESDDLLAMAPPEGQISRPSSTSTPPQHIQEFDDERDELDLIGSPVPSPARTLSSAESVIHIIHSNSQQVLEVEPEVTEDDAGVPTPQEPEEPEEISPDITMEPVSEKERTVPLQEETDELEADEIRLDTTPRSFEDDQMDVDEQPIVSINELQEPIAIKDLELQEEQGGTLEVEEEKEQLTEKDIEIGMEPEEPSAEEKSQGVEMRPLQPHFDLEDGIKPPFPSLPTISYTFSPKPYPSHLAFAPVAAVPARRPITIPFPCSPLPIPPIFNFDYTLSNEPSSPKIPTSPVQPRHQFNPQYTLPSLKALPIEFNRKGKPTKQQRKREKEREKNAGSEKGDVRKDKDIRDDWVPMGLNKWGATIRANPVWKKVARASKCLSTREWGIAMSELRLIRTLDRIEMLKDHGRWSFRQPKKQRGVGGLTKTYWDYLMDEMKWMRIDFREERKWKMALAYNLSTAVLQWHAAGTLAERVERGVCVLWKRSRVDTQETVMNIDTDADALTPDSMLVDEKPQSKNSLLMVDYGSDDEDEEEQDKDQQSVVDALETAALIHDALDAAERGERDEGIGLKSLEPKAEDIEDSSLLQNGENAMDVDKRESSQDCTIGKENEEEAASARTAGMELKAGMGLKATSADPLLTSKSNSQSTAGDAEPSISATKSVSRSSIYAPLRERIAYSDEEKLFLDLDDFNDAEVEPSSMDLEVEHLFPSPDLSTIFPDLQPLGLLDIPPVVTSVSGSEGKKRSEKRSDRDDPNKRAEDTTYTKLFPIGQFMYYKPTLLGPLQPSKRWKNSQWSSPEENTVAPECENALGRISDENASGLFDNKSNNSPSTNPSSHAFPPIKDSRKRTIDHLWTGSDDSLLKSLIDRYGTNWLLISECFNASRITIPTDQRTPRDCRDRWAEKWAAESRPGSQVKSQDLNSAGIVEGTPPPIPPPPSGQMTTRGIKRLASASISGYNSVGSAVGPEPKKRRRHMLIQDTIRKAAKKRADWALKISANQRKPSAIHDTHGQYNKMPQMSPADLSRIKAEKEAKEQQDLTILRRRQEELQRQQTLREQAVQRIQQQQQQQQQANGTQRPAGQGPPPGPVVPQIRSQVNISQQQRIGTPMSATSRLSPQHLHQVQQARVAQQQGQAHAQALAQVQALAQSQNAIPSMNGNGSNIGNTHLSPQYTPRDATSSPAHASPPRNSATPSNATTSPGPQSAQTGMLQAPQVPGNAMPRQSISMGGQQYYLPPGIAGTFTQEQIHVLRAQMMQVHQAQGTSQGPQNLNGAFPPQT